MASELFRAEWTRRSDVLLWVLLAAAWSSSYTVIKIAVAALDPLVLVAGRMVVATVILAALFFAFGRRLSRAPLDWASYGVTGLLGSVIPFLLITRGEQVVDSALTAILMGSAPILTSVLAAVALPSERITMRVGLGLIGAFSGVILLAGPTVLLDLGRQFVGQAQILAAAACYAATTVYVRRFVSRPPMEMAVGSSLVGTLVIMLILIASGAKPLSIEPSVGTLFPILYLGMISTAAANLTYFYLVPRLGATRMSQVNFAVPVGGACLGAVILGEVLSPSQVAALVLIVASIALVTTTRPRAA